MTNQIRPLSSLMDLEGRVALVTGAAGHLGSVMAGTLAELGADLLLVDLDAARAEELAQRLEEAHGIRAVAAGTDLEDEAAVSIGAQN